MRGIAAGCAMSVGRLDTAVELAYASTRENANHPYVWRVLLIAHARLGNIPQAKHAYGKLQLLQQDLTISKYVARSKLNTNDLNIAIAALRATGVPE